jgi:KDO2-lipid IV(A) lauroyltransferase
MTQVKRSRREKKRPSLVYLVRCIALIARLLPYRVSVLIGGALGRIAYVLLPSERKRACENLEAVFPGRDAAWVRRTARRTFVHLGKALLESVAIRPGIIPDVVTVRGIDTVRSALDEGRGAVYVTGHIGNWELMAGAVSQTFPLSVIAAPLKPEPMNDMIVALREGLGIRTIIRGRPGAAKELIRVFRENRVLGILIDQDTDVEGAFVDFLGRKAWTPTAAAQMAIRFHAPVLFGYIHREQDGRHTVTIEGPIEMTRTGSEHEDIAANTALLTKKIEDAILRDPVQWVWMHRRWRRQP